MKIYITILSAMFMLNSCATEEKKLERNPNYDYVEIEECTIPVLKEFKLKYTKVDGGKGTFDFIEKNHKKIRTYHIGISKSYINIDNKYSTRKEEIEQRKDTRIFFEKITNKFQVIGWESVNTSIRFVNYEFFGVNTMIVLNEYGKEIKQKKDLDYLLDYCQKTWKLNKKKEK